MCGIAGAFGPGRTGDPVARMAGALSHRGPDDSGFAELRAPGGARGGTLVHRRLSILDLSSAGHQPMRTPDGRYTLVYNGEIYNFQALRAELEAEGERFASHSDSEVLLLGWARHGRAFLPRLRGMFAFAVWDERTGTGALVRDPFGIKPLYLAEAGGALLFASEVRAVLASGLVPRVLSAGGVRSFLATGSVAEPFTAVEGVTALPAGTVLEVSVRDGRLRAGHPEAYGPDPLAGGHAPLDRRRAPGAVREALREAVAHHLVSDVPVGFFLSGGIDSSAVVALAAEAGQGEMNTFTVTFAEERFSEAAPARLVAERFGTRHHEIPLSAARLLEALPEAFAAMDQPSIDGLNTYVVSRAVRERGIKVVLSGLGGDELFAGYPSFHRASWLSGISRVPATLRRMAAQPVGRMAGARGEKLELLLSGGSPAESAYRASRALFGERQVAALAGRGAAAVGPAAPGGLSLLQQVSWHEVTGYMRNTLLRDSDWFSMAHGLELRVPFVDTGVAAAAMRVEDRLKLRRGLSKPVLLDAVKDLLPREVWDRPKQGFTLPFEGWMRGELRAEVDAQLQPAALRAAGLAPEAARGLWGGYLAGTGVSWSRPWALYTLLRWAARHGLRLEAGAPAEAAG
ncbi:MAG TPA: asparagine synthase (glutamine-hydrolyzing) [Longimicrobiaceae bacterium]|nr:asparagine synthase (glutamine-hydrolyzing) [Longimicrobiaceae bacterium]